eukprot:305574-Amphidinium_carterae.1
MANHSSGTILAKARRDKSPMTPMPTASNGIQTMLTKTNPTFGSRTVNSGTMTTIKEQLVVGQMFNNHNRYSTLACSECVLQ